MISLQAESEFWKQRVNKEETAENLATLWPLYKESLFSETSKNLSLKKIQGQSLAGTTMEIRCDPNNPQHFWPVERVSTAKKQDVDDNLGDEAADEVAELTQQEVTEGDDNNMEMMGDAEIEVISGDLDDTDSKLPSVDSRPGTSMSMTSRPRTGMSMSSLSTNRATTPSKNKAIDRESVTPKSGDSLKSNKQKQSKYKYLKTPGRLNVSSSGSSNGGRPLTPAYENAKVNNMLQRRQLAFSVRSKTPTAAQMSSRSRSALGFSSSSGSRTPSARLSSSTQLPHLKMASEAGFGYKRPDPMNAYNTTSRVSSSSNKKAPKLSTFYNTMLSNKIYL
jgi:hypothetical protein